MTSKEGKIIECDVCNKEYGEKTAKEVISKCPVCKNDFCNDCQGYAFTQIGNSPVDDITKVAHFTQVHEGILLCKDCLESDTFGSFVAVIKQMAEIVTNSGVFNVEVKFERH